MNVHDEMSEDEVLRAAARSLSAIPVATAPDARAIMARGRARRRRRLTGLGLGGTAAAAVAALGVAGAFGGGTVPLRGTGIISTAAFTLVNNANGTATLTLSQDQVFNPAALQQALAQDGIPALVKIGAFCSSDHAPSMAGVISVQLPDGTPVPRSYPGHRYPIPPSAVTVINPALMPTGTELFFDYLNNNHTVALGLIYTGSHTCVSGLPPGPAAP
jgi:hypothetical protein